MEQNEKIDKKTRLIFIAFFVVVGGLLTAILVLTIIRDMQEIGELVGTPTPPRSLPD